ncbi:hypothetical protein WG902_14145 [Ramlibacter sp. PS3R-8]|uniref:hypothetical protein n=1 Tax=Ramlibacter sp. PS3R-8 TaxID=3133437 RepID=UPI0030AE315B
MALFTATPARRRAAMIALLSLASAGAVIRVLAPNPSTLRDIGTLLLVLWLPAVGNLVAWFARRIPRKVPPATQFAPGAAFAPQWKVRLEDQALPMPEAASVLIVVGRNGFVGRMGPMGDGQDTMLELLHPQSALPHLGTGTQFHVLVREVAVAKGRVLEALGPRLRGDDGGESGDEGGEGAGSPGSPPSRG